MVLNEYKNFHNDSIKIIWVMISIFVCICVYLYVRVCIRVGHITWKLKYQKGKTKFYEKWSKKMGDNFFSSLKNFS